MKRRRRKARSSMRVLHLWTYPQAEQAKGYLRSVLGSLREQWLEARKQTVHAERIASRRMDRRAIWAHEDAVADLGKAEDRFNEALEELMRLDVYLLDPVEGLALIPFQQGEDLAWYVFDLHDPDGLTSWRYHSDPLETRRPMDEAKIKPIAFKK